MTTEILVLLILVIVMAVMSMAAPVVHILLYWLVAKHFLREPGTASAAHASADSRSQQESAEMEPEPTEAQRREREQLIAEQQAFNAMLGYNADIAYGIGAGLSMSKE